jgi:hypothetical protein
LRPSSTPELLPVPEWTPWEPSKKLPSFPFAGDSLDGTAARLIETASRNENVPAAYADFVSDPAIGRIIFWVTGEVDLEVLDGADGESLLFRHETVESLDSRQLEEAFAAFMAAMTGTDLEPKFARLHKALQQRNAHGVQDAIFGLSPIHNGWKAVPDEVIERLIAVLANEEMYKSPLAGHVLNYFEFESRKLSSHQRSLCIIFLNAHGDQFDHVHSRQVVAELCHDNYLK